MRCRGGGRHPLAELETLGGSNRPTTRRDRQRRHIINLRGFDLSYIADATRAPKRTCQPTVLDGGIFHRPYPNVILALEATFPAGLVTIILVNGDDGEFGCTQGFDMFGGRLLTFRGPRVMIDNLDHFQSTLNNF